MALPAVDADQVIVECFVTMGSPGTTAVDADQAIMEALVPVPPTVVVEIDQEVTESFGIKTPTFLTQLDQIIVECFGHIPHLGVTVDQTVIEAFGKSPTSLPITITIGPPTGPILYQITQTGPEVIPIPPGNPTLSLTGSAATPVWVFASPKSMSPYKAVQTKLPP